jgi:hypothetical protein
VTEEFGGAIYIAKFGVHVEETREWMFTVNEDL